MALNYLDAKPISDIDDNPTIYTPTTPPETIATSHPEDDSHFDPTKPSSSIPWPGSTFILRNPSSGRVLTLLDGQVVLASPGGRGCIYWACVESKGWLGFKNISSGKYLGHNVFGDIICGAGEHQGWENFCVRMNPEGKFVLLLTHWEKLWFVTAGTDALWKCPERGDAVIWEFVKVS